MVPPVVFESGGMTHFGTALPVGVGQVLGAAPVLSIEQTRAATWAEVGVFTAITPYLAPSRAALEIVW